MIAYLKMMSDLNSSDGNVGTELKFTECEVTDTFLTNNVVT